MNAAIEKGLSHADQTKVVEVGRGVLARVGEIVRDSMDVGEASVLVVADERTWAAAGEAVDASLRAAGLRVEDALIFPALPPCTRPTSTARRSVSGCVRPVRSAWRWVPAP